MITSDMTASTTEMPSRTPFVTFLETTSMKGIPRVVKSTSMVIRCLWVVAVIGLSVATVIQVKNLVEAYLSYSTTTTLSQVRNVIFGDNPNIGMPSLIVCNLQPIAAYSVIEHDESEGTEEAGQRGKEATFTNSFHDYKKALYKLALCQGCSKEEKRYWREKVDTLRTTRGYLQYAGLSEASILGHKPEVFIQECYVLFYQGLDTIKIPCDEYSVRRTLLFSPDYLNCYSFTLINQTIHDIKLGLSLVLHLDNYMDNTNKGSSHGYFLSQGAGVRLANAQPNFLPRIDQTGFNVAPGTFSDVKFKLKKVEKLGPPYSNCCHYEQSWDDFLNYGLEYSGESCAYLCTGRKIQKLCKCTDPSHPPEILSDKSPKYCESAKRDRDDLKEKIECLNQHRLPAYFYCVTRRCCSRCAYVNSDLDVSYSKWPVIHQVKTFYGKFIRGRPYEYHYKQYMEKLNQSLSDKLLLVNMIRDNFVKIEWYLGSQDYLSFVEQPSMSLSSLMSQVGASLNFWAGITVIIAIELLELLLQVLLSNEVKVKQEPNPPEKSQTSQTVITSGEEQTDFVSLYSMK